MTSQIFSLICAWINGQVNNREAGDLRRNRAHYMTSPWWVKMSFGELGVVSLTFRDLSKIILQKYTIPEITFMMRISSWNFVCVPKAWLWAHVQSFSLKFSSEVWFLQYTNFEIISWRARETLVKQPPVVYIATITATESVVVVNTVCWPYMFYQKSQQGRL